MQIQGRHGNIIDSPLFSLDSLDNYYSVAVLSNDDRIGRSFKSANSHCNKIVVSNSVPTVLVGYNTL